MTIRFEMQVKGDKNLIRKITKYSSKLSENGKLGMRRLAEFVQTVARSNIPIWGGGGTLAAGIKIQKVNKNSIKLASTASYGSIQEFGYHEMGIPYPVVQFPLYGKLLAWAKEKNPVWARKTRGHATITGYTPYMRPAWKEAKSKISDIMNGAAVAAKKDSNL